MTGLVIVPTFDASVTSQANAAQIEAAVNAEIAVFQGLIATPLTVNLNIGWGEVGGTALAAGALEGRSADPSITLSQGQLYGTTINRVFHSFGFDNQDVTSVPLGTAMALGFTPAAPLSASIGFSATANWDFGGGPAIAAGAYDFQGVVAHDVSQVLGRVADTAGSPWFSELFRYVLPYQAVGGGLDYAGTYFSVDNGQSRGFTYLPDTADWDPASSGPDAFAAPVAGAKLVISQPDLNDLRALGYDLINTTDYTATITTNYQNYFGRAPFASELATWRAFLHDDADVSVLEARLAADYSFQQHYQTVGIFLYGYYADAGNYYTFDSSIVAAAVASGQTDKLRASVITSASGQAYVAHVVTGLYDIYVGRDPNASELATWQASILAGDGYDAVRATLVASAEGQGHTAKAVTELYQTYFGRAPNASELSGWQNTIADPVPGTYSNPGAHDFVDIYRSLVSSTEGQAHATPVITQLYQTYMGRAPTAGELKAWETVYLEQPAVNPPDISKGASDYYNSGNYAVTSRTAGTGYIPQATLLQEYNLVRTAILDDYYGQQHTVAQTTTLYDTYFGRDPTSSELAVWSASLLAGATYDQMQDQLERESTAANVQHVAVATHPMAVTYGTGAAGQYLTIDHFEASQDTVTLSSATFAGINPLDAAHAGQIIAPTDGSTDVLITLDATHSILFEHTMLTALHASDFVFG